MQARRSNQADDSRRYPWVRYSDARLLDLRFCDLHLVLAHTPVQQRVEQLHAELAARNLRFKPHCWFSDEWFAPDGVPGIAIPFYLGHPRLTKLEDAMMLEVEGGTKTSCMQLLRHEAGHAIQNAFRLNRRKQWQRVFGRSTVRYPEYYSPKPFSRKHVLHLDWWYAQSHPCEDFAETFAVWLRPGSQWRRRYRGWPALRKLEYVDALMQEIAGQTPPVRSRERMNPLSELTHTLRAHYEERQARYGGDYPEYYDRDLRRLFAGAETAAGAPPAAQWLRRIGPSLVRHVARWTGEPAYVVHQVLKPLVARCRELDLRVTEPGEGLKLDTAILLTMQVTHYLHSSRHRVAL